MDSQNNGRKAQLGAYVALAVLGFAGLIVITAAEAWNSTNEVLKANITTVLPVTLVSICGFGSIGLMAVAAVVVAWTRRPSASDEPVRIRPSMALPYRPEPQRVYALPAPVAPAPVVYSAWRGDLANANERVVRDAYRENVIQYADDYDEPRLDAPSMPSMPAPAPSSKLTVRLGEGGDEISISRDAWMAFAMLAKPTRDAWRAQLEATGGRAPNSDYSKCHKIAVAYNAIGGRGEWASAEARDNLTAWLCPSPTAAG